MTFKAIADELGLPEGTVVAICNRALYKIQLETVEIFKRELQRQEDKKGTPCIHC